MKYKHIIFFKNIIVTPPDYNQIQGDMWVWCSKERRTQQIIHEQGGETQDSLWESFTCPICQKYNDRLDTYSGGDITKMAQRKEKEFQKLHALLVKVSDKIKKLRGDFYDELFEMRKNT